MNFTLDELRDLFRKIYNILLDFEEGKYDNIASRIYLANGDVIDYNVPKTCIPHLLCLNINYLISTGLFEKGNAFDVAKNICNSPRLIFDQAKSGYINFEKIFSPYILEKSEGFLDNIQIRVFETEFVCKYSPQRSYGITDKNLKPGYVVARKHKNGKYGILCLVKQENSYVPYSNQFFDDEQKYEDALDIYYQTNQ